MNINIKPGQTVYIIRCFPSWKIEGGVVKEICTGDGRQYEPSHGDDCHVRLTGRAIEWHKPSDVYETENEAKLALASNLRNEAKALVEWASTLVAEATPPKPVETGIPTPKSVELHLGTSPEFARYSKKVKALGGRYSDCRGNAYKRFVHLPWTPEGRELANRLIAEFGRGKRTTAIVRGVDRYNDKHVNAPVIVHNIDQHASNPCESLRLAYEAAFEKAFPDCLASV